ncbi:tyrosine-type recombinase/integrase [Lactiplantibacillus plantarum]
MKLTKINKYQHVFSYKSKTGTRYAIRVTYYDVNGKRHEKQQRGFSTALLAHQAELKYSQMEAQQESQQLLDSTITMKAWSERFWELRKANWRKSTTLDYQCMLNKWVIPLLGSQRLDQLTKPKYEYLFIQPLLKRLSPTTVQQYHRFVMLIINTAVDAEILNHNRLAGIKFDRTTRHNAFSKTDLKAFNSALDKLVADYKPFFLLLEQSGMRKGEALALNWDDVDTKHQTITINKTRSWFGTGEPKTSSSNRVIAISASVVNMLRHYQLYQRSKCLMKGDKFSKTDVIFTNDHNRPLDPKTTNRYFNKALEYAGISAHKYVIHSLRHTHATLLLDAGINPVEVAHRLGHANANITLSTYAHVVPDADQILANTFEALINE